MLTTPSTATTLPGTVATTDMALSTARGVLMLMPMLRLRPRLMLRLTMLCTATTLPGTADTTDTASSMARGALTLMPKLRLRLRLMLRLRPTTLSTATTPLDMLPTRTSTCTERGALMPRLTLSLTCTATDMATPTGPTMATTTASKGVQNYDRMLCFAALN